jgi:hypothetical protein
MWDAIPIYKNHEKFHIYNRDDAATGATIVQMIVKNPRIADSGRFRMTVSNKVGTVEQQHRLKIEAKIPVLDSQKKNKYHHFETVDDAVILNDIPLMPKHEPLPVEEPPKPAEPENKEGDKKEGEEVEEPPKKPMFDE